MKNLFIALFILLVGAQLSAYQLTGSKWDVNSGTKVSYYIANDLDRTMTDAVVVDAIQKSFQAWVDVSCSFLEYNYLGRINFPETNTGLSKNDGKNVVSWRHQYWPDSAQALAVTATMSYYGGRTADSDIVFNGVNHSWAVDGNRYKTDVQAVATHEIGHFNGLGHTNQYGATMYPATGAGMLGPRILKQDDINGICYLYDSGQPNTGGTTGGGTTGSTNPGPGASDPYADLGTDCPNGQCNTGFCVRDPRFQTPYCTNGCSQGGCPTGYQCYQTNAGSACAKVSAGTPGNNGGNNGGTSGTPSSGGQFGDDCGQQQACSAGLNCISDGRSAPYCSNQCSTQADCADGAQCYPTQNGFSTCVKTPGSGGNNGSTGNTGGGSNPGNNPGQPPTGGTGDNGSGTGTAAPGTPSSGQGGNDVGTVNDSSSGGSSASSEGGCNLNNSTAASSYPSFIVFMILLAGLGILRRERREGL